MKIKKLIKGLKSKDKKTLELRLADCEIEIKKNTTELTFQSEAIQRVEKMGIKDL